jgi:two-component system chemotaxis response regulator CheB
MSFEIVVVGTSTGGLKALQTLLPSLPEEFSLPIVVVQHRSKDSESGLCQFLNRFSVLPVVEPEDKEQLQRGRVYLAPRDYHLLLEKQSVALSTDPAVGFARPSIDVLFESAADEYQERAIGVILTGANRDGARGLAAIKSRGGATIVEDPASATRRELPDAAIAATQADGILPLHEIGPRLKRLSESARQRVISRQDARKVTLHYGS